MSRNERDTERIAARFAKTLRGGEIILLSGELGAGKTVFVRGLARALGVRGRITSPTFVLMRIHRVVRRESRVVRNANAGRHLTPHASRLTPINYLVHVDAYRIHDARELEAIGLDEWIGRPDAIVAIEWGERIRRLFTASHRVILESSPRRRDVRRITITRRTQMQRVHK